MAINYNQPATLGNLQRVTENMKTYIDSDKTVSIKGYLKENNTHKFYNTSTPTADTTPIFSFDVATEYFLDQTKTMFVQEFIWSDTEYVGSTNPNLEGKPVFVLAVKGEDNTVSYSFVNLETLVSTYKTKNTATLSLDITDNEISGNVNISAEEGNAITSKDDGLYVSVASETKISETENNAIEIKDDGLYVSTVSETKISEETGNQIISKDDGIYVAQTDLSEYTKTTDLEIQLEDYVLDSDMEIIDLATLESMLGLSTEELEGLASLLSDQTIELSKTWSSSKIYSELNTTLDSAKQYTLDELSKAIGASYKVVTSVDQMTDSKVLYLLKDTDSGMYNIYVYDADTSTAELIGSFEINLDDYYTKAESENLFATKADVTANYATKTELQEAVEDVEIEVTTTLDVDSTDTQVPSAKAVYDELQNIENNYLPLTGGTQYKNASIYNHISTDLRDVLYGIDHNGALIVKDDTNGKYLIVSSADGATTYYGNLDGTASGNLPLTGGNLSGNIEIIQSETNQAHVVVANDTVRGAFVASPEGNLVLRNTTIDKNIVVSKVDGTNTFNGTANGNLPLSGGTLSGELYTNDGYVRIYGDTERTYLGHIDTVGNYDGRYLSINSKDVETKDALVFRERTNGTNTDYTVIHSGNIDTMLGGIRFGVDENGNYGYIKAGADTVTPFRTAPTGDYSTYTYVSGTAGSHSTISLNVEWYSLYLVELQSGTEDTILSAMETLTGMEIKQTIQTGSTNYNNTKVKWYICEATSNVISITVVDGVAINLIKIE